MLSFAPLYRHSVGTPLHISAQTIHCYKLVTLGYILDTDSVRLSSLNVRVGLVNELKLERVAQSH